MSEVFEDTNNLVEPTPEPTPIKKRKRKKRKKKTTAETFALIQSFVLRAFAVSVSYVFKAISTGSLIGVSIKTAVLWSALMGMATLFEHIARKAALNGEITEEDINDAFVKTDQEIDNANLSPYTFQSYGS